MPKYRDLVGLGGGELVYSYTASIEHDENIAREALHVLLAHAVHLAEEAIIPGDAACKIIAALREMLAEPGSLLREGYEDVWEAFEDVLYDRVGDAAGYLFLGRSRNDHVSAALRLWARGKAASTAANIIAARRHLLEKARLWSRIPVVLHTHGLPSQIGFASCIAMAWEEALASSTELLLAALKLVDRSPLGASAGAGTLAPIRPERLAWLLGFDSTIASSIYSAGSRMDLFSLAAASALFLEEASRIASDIIMYSSPYIALLKLPEKHISTSSVMPHKRNPVTLEVLRARAARAAGSLASLLAIAGGLPNGYSLDLQEANKILYMIILDAYTSSQILEDLLSEIEWEASSEPSRVMAWGAELAEAIALNEKIPFRRAYRMVAEALRSGRVRELLEKQGYHDPLELAASRATGCAPRAVERAWSIALERLERHSSMIEPYAAKLVGYQQRLLSAADEVLKACR
ncbi:MAG: argininosuccinate lyase [Hyperthermus sp.]|nr:MAG: argininosuccinate lyase [Hyperthermus sp.]